MTERERTELAELSTRLFGLDGTGGAIGQLTDDIEAIRSKVDRWDGAVSFVKAAAGIVGFGGLVAILTALVRT